MGSDPSESPEGKFWKWFQSQDGVLQTFDPADQPEEADRILDLLLEHLAEVKEGLTCEISSPGEDGKRDFVVSADGIRELFPAVRRLVRAAPELKHWVVIAFRPRQGSERPVSLGDLSLDPARIWFRAIPREKKVDLYLFLKDFKRYSKDDVVHADPMKARASAQP